MLRTLEEHGALTILFAEHDYTEQAPVHLGRTRYRRNPLQGWIDGKTRPLNVRPVGFEMIGNGKEVLGLVREAIHTARDVP